MKYSIKNCLLILAILMSMNLEAKAQQTNNYPPTLDSTFKKQADSLRNSFAKDGFVIVKEAKMTMESEYEMPVIVPLKEGSWYEFAFIGDVSSKLYEVRMYDETEKQVVYLKHYGNGMESNIISYSYIPKFSAYHIIKPVQLNKKKKKNLCGYIMMFKKVS